MIKSTIFYLLKVFKYVVILFYFFLKKKLYIEVLTLREVLLTRFGMVPT
jgi:hypothetical protein